MSRAEFEGLVVEALDSLPDEFLSHFANLDIVVEREPSVEQLAEQGMSGDETLLGLYEGIPQVDREGYGLVLPDKITIFQLPIEKYSGDREEIVEQVRTTVVHEVAHHFGITDEALHEMGLG